MTQDQIRKAARRARSNLYATLVAHRNAFTLGWCAAFVQFSRLHIVQRAQLVETRA